MNPAVEKLRQRIQQSKSLLCVGLDPDLAKLPKKFLELPNPQWEFCKWVIDQTAQYVCAFKPNPAFFEARGHSGMAELFLVCQYITEQYPKIFLILDSKRGDIGNTNLGYCEEAFGWANADAVTVSPYLAKKP